MSVRTDVINLSINVQGNAAQNQLNDLRKKASDLRFEMQGLKKGTEEYAAKAKELQTVTAEIDKLKQTIGLTSLTQKELTQELTRLKALKGSMVPFTEEFKAMEKQIRAVENRLYEVKNGVQGVSAFFSKISDEVKQFGVVAAGYLGFQFITDQFRNIINGAGHLSDSLADIRRVSNETDTEVRALNKSLGQMDTRTSTDGLRNIALIAGKLGVAKDDIVAFTKATDMLVVALGDELGDADQITTQLGKILNVFDGEITGDNITKLGNAIVDLANKGVASGPFLVDFAQRVAGIAKTANISLSSVLGLAAGLEESGQKVEASSTAIQKLISDIANDLPKAAQVAGVDVAKFNELFAKDPQEALLQYAAGLQRNKQSFAEISASFADAGEEGARTVAVLATLGQKTDFFRSKMQAAGDAIQQTNEITEAFNLKNQTFGATLDKLGKEFNSLVSSGFINNFLTNAVEGTLSFLKALKDLPNYINENRTTLIALTTVITAYVAAKSKATQAAILERIATVLETAAEKIEMAQMLASNVVRQVTIALQSAYIVVTNLLTGRITLATAAQRLWNITTSAFGGAMSAVILIAGGLITVLSYLADKTKELSAAQQIANEVQRRAGEATADEINKINLLKAALTDQNSSYENKQKALNALIALNPAYLNGLTLENIKTKEGKDLLDKYILSLTQKAELEAKQSILTDKLKQRNQVYADFREIDVFKNKSDADLEKIINKNEILLSRGAADISGGLEQLIKKKFSGYDFDAAKETIAQVKLLQDDLTKSAIKNVETVTGATGAIVQQSNTRTIETIKAQIKTLDDAYVKIDVTNKTALQKNVADRKKLQSELDKIEGKQNPEDKKENGIIQKLKDFQAELQRVGKTQDESEIARIEQKYRTLVKEAGKYAADVVGLEQDKNRAIAFLIDEETRKRKEASEKLFKETAAKEYENQVAQTALYYDQLKEVESQRYVDGLEDKAQFEANLLAIDVASKQAQVQNAKDYSATVEKAAGDVTKFQSEELQKQVKALEAANEKKLANTKLLAELDKKARLSAAENAVKTAPDGSRQQFEAKKRLLKVEHEAELAELDEQKTKTILAIKGQYAEELKLLIEQLQAKRKIELALVDENDPQAQQKKDSINNRFDNAIDVAKIESAKNTAEKLAQINSDYNSLVSDADKLFKKKQSDDDKDYWKGRVDQIAGFANDALNVLSAFQNIQAAREKAQLNRELKANDQRKAAYKKQLDSKLMSEAVYNANIAKIDADSEKKKEAIAKKQFERNKKMQIAQTIINGAAGEIKLWLDPGFPAAIPLAVALGIETLASVATIASTKYDDSGAASYGKGGLLENGPYHSDEEKGLHVVDPRTGKTEMLLEKDEAVMNGNAMRSNENVTVSGTPSQIASALNSRYGGVSWTTGATVSAPKWVTSKPVQINPSIPRIMGAGGLTYKQTTTAKETEPDGEIADLMRELIDETKQNREELKNMKTKLHAVVSIKEFRKEEEKYDAAKQASGMA